MKKALALLGAILAVGLFVLVIYQYNDDKKRYGVADIVTNTMPTLEQAAPKEVTIAEKYREIEQEFNLVRRDAPSQGWTREVFPGEERSPGQVEGNLYKIWALLDRLENLSPSERYSDLKHEIQLFMAHEMTNLLVVSRRDRDLRGLENFLRFASRMDTSPDTFGVSPDELKKEALVMARKEIATLRPRLLKGSGDAQRQIQHILRAWRFTPSQLGLTLDDLKNVVPDK